MYICIYTYVLHCVVIFRLARLSSSLSPCVVPLWTAVYVHPAVCLVWSFFLPVNVLVCTSERSDVSGDVRRFRGAHVCMDGHAQRLSLLLLSYLFPLCCILVSSVFTRKTFSSSVFILVCGVSFSIGQKEEEKGEEDEGERIVIAALFFFFFFKIAAFFTVAYLQTRLVDLKIFRSAAETGRHRQSGDRKTDWHECMQGERSNSEETNSS